MILQEKCDIWENKHLTNFIGMSWRQLIFLESLTLLPYHSNCILKLVQNHFLHVEQLRITYQSRNCAALPAWKHSAQWVSSTLGCMVGERVQPDCSHPPWSGLLSCTNAGRQGQGEEYNWLPGLTRSLLIRGRHFGVKTPQKVSHGVESCFDRMKPSRECKQI